MPRTPAMCLTHTQEHVLSEHSSDEVSYEILGTWRSNKGSDKWEMVEFQGISSIFGLFSYTHLALHGPHPCKIQYSYVTAVSILYARICI